jgi:sigma-B regulation protein RsbU (phosphoserine phosphatase)
MVGLETGADYIAHEIKFERGDILFAYTDGLTDTINPEGEYFSREEIIPRFSGGEKLASVLDQIHNEIKDYSTGAKQSDDITMLAMRCLE